MPMSVPAVLAAWMQPCVRLHPRSMSPRSGSRSHRSPRVGAPSQQRLVVMGLDHGAGFAVYHRVLSLRRWLLPPSRTGFCCFSLLSWCGGTGRDRP